MSSIYDGQFRGSVLVVGKTGCSKTTVLQKLRIDNFFGKIVKTGWVSGIEIDEKIKAKIQSCLDNEVEINISNKPDKLDLLLENFKLRTRDLIDDDVNLNNSVFGENKKNLIVMDDRPIVMDDVSRVAHISKEFANF